MKTKFLSFVLMASIFAYSSWAGKYAVFVIGAPRSGTSCVAGVLSRLGLPIGNPEHLKKADHNNVKGYFENRPLMELNEKILNRYNASVAEPIHIDFSETEQNLQDVKLIQDELVRQFGEDDHLLFKDVRTTLLLPFYVKATELLGFSPKFIWVERDIDEVTKSGQAFRFSDDDIKMMGKEQIALIKENVPAISQKIKKVYEQEIAIHLKEEEKLIKVTFDELIKNHYDVVDKMKSFLPDLKVPDNHMDAIRQFIDPTLKHHNKSQG
jgi:hypothetical protein